MRIDYEPLLGEVSDALVAALFGMSASGVAGARWRRGIPACNALRILRIEWARLDFLLGWFTDLEVAKLLNAKRQNVSAVRNARGWPPRFPPGRRPAQAEKARAVYPGDHPRGEVFSPDDPDPYRAAFAGCHPVDGLLRLIRYMRTEEIRFDVGPFDVGVDRDGGAVLLLGESLTPDQADELALALKAAAGMMRRFGPDS